MIDYEKISAAIAFYESRGYKYIEVPWLVPLDTMLVTRPRGTNLFSTFAGNLVASGEQSFIEIRKTLKKGKYQCVTPCFRDELVKDKWHHQQFIKNELIYVLDDEYLCKQLVDEVVKDASDFFSKYAPINVIKTLEPETHLCKAYYTQDILINNIEVGSYGFREAAVEVKYGKDFFWIYGTGCAEPRLSQVLNEKI